MIASLMNWLLPEMLRHDRERYRLATRVAAFDLALLSFGPVFALIFAVLGAPVSSNLVISASLLLTANSIYLRNGGNVLLSGHIVTAVAFSVYTALATVNGGHHSAPMLWYVSVPVFAIALCGTRAGFVWTGISVITIIAFYVACENGLAFPDEPTPEGKRFLECAGLLGILLCVLFLTFLFNRVEQDAQRTIQDALVEAQAADCAKSEFLANMSHEIRTPMTAILGYTDLLYEGNLDEAQTEDVVRTIKRNGDHLLAIINDILDLSKIDAGKLVVDEVVCSPLQLVAEVVELMRVRVESKGLVLLVQFEDHVPETIVTDPTRLRQILINLIGNAIKFTEEGGIRLVVRTCKTQEGLSQLRFEVIDTGIGMSSEQIARLFHAFSQADSSTTRRFGGTGLGLAISRRLAEMLGGLISVTSAPGEGSTFFLNIAAKLPKDAECSLPAVPRIALEDEAARAAGAPLAGCRLLLAEDFVDNQRLISHVLRKAGAEVALAENGETAIALALAARDSENPFDIILMDMQMPVLDGYEATRRLRQRGYQRPIIALTAHSMDSDRKKCLDAGCNDFTSKPIDRAKLIALVAAYSARAVEPHEPVLAMVP